MVGVVEFLEIGMTSRLFLVAALAVVAAGANAQSLKFVGTQLPNPETVTALIGGGTERTVQAVGLKFTDGTNSYETYCADIMSSLDSGFHNYSHQLIDMNQNNGLSLAAKILAENVGRADTTQKQAGLQMAIWEALFDGGASFNENAGDLRFSVQTKNSLLEYAGEYYANGVVSTLKPVAYHAYSQGHGSQSQIYLASVPEPATMAAIGAGVAFLARRRKKNAK